MGHFSDIHLQITENKREELWQKHTKLVVTDAYGIYCPSTFLERFPDVEGISDEDRAIVEAGPDHENEWYWEAWDNILRNGSVTLDNIKYDIDQDGDVRLINWTAINEEWDAFCEEHGISADFIS